MGGMGQDGPWRDFVTFAPTIHALTGLTYLTNPPGRHDLGYGFSLTDHLSGLAGALAALEGRGAPRPHGRGPRNRPCAVRARPRHHGASTASTISRNGANPEPVGNRHPFGLGAARDLPAAGDDRWVAIAVRGDDEWAALCGVMGRPELATRSRFATHEARIANQDALDADSSGMDHAPTTATRSGRLPGGRRPGGGRPGRRGPDRTRSTTRVPANFSRHGAPNRGESTAGALPRALQRRTPRRPTRVCTKPARTRSMCSRSCLACRMKRSLNSWPRGCVAPESAVGVSRFLQPTLLCYASPAFIRPEVPVTLRLYSSLGRPLAAVHDRHSRHRAHVRLWRHALRRHASRPRVLLRPVRCTSPLPDVSRQRSPLRPEHHRHRRRHDHGLEAPGRTAHRRDS